MTSQARGGLVETIGQGGLCRVSGRLQKLVRFDDAARIYEFSDPDGSHPWTVSDEAFSKGLYSLAPHHSGDR